MLNQNAKVPRGNRNEITISGTFTKEFKYSHTTDSGEDFYKNTLQVRKDGNIESITIIASENIIYKMNLVKNKHVEIKGTIKTRQVMLEKEKTGNDVIVFAKKIEPCKEKSSDENLVYLEGRIKLKPARQKNIHYRASFIFIAVCRNNGIVDTIPCKFYEKEAKFIKRLQIGTKVQITGLIESKNKLKLLEGGSVEIVTVHHVTALEFNVLEQ
ncbi:MAG: hypothetical protein HFJ48_01900 [Clostridia bacterium]|nr:hypothetical protein [Clostridia bacterium]